MARITFIRADGSACTLSVRAGGSVMEAARRSGVPGIDGVCGGNCSCVTCHVYLEPEWLETVGAPSPLEESMLDFADAVDARSRLSCQITVSAALDGLVVRMPSCQHTPGL